MSGAIYSATTLRVGRTFTGVTLKGRVIPLGKVIDYAGWRDAKYRVKWFDENGKHYEWFNLDDVEVEFKEIQFIT